MSEQNVELVRKGIEAFNRQDLTAGLALWSDDGELDWSRSNGPLKGVYRGHDGLERFWKEFWATFEGVVIEPEEFIESGTDVVVVNTARIRGRDGIEVIAKSAFVFTVEDGLQTRLQMFQEKTEALQAVGLSEQA
jgi:ketosteroid isomerase-like protein